MSVAEGDKKPDETTQKSSIETLSPVPEGPLIPLPLSPPPLPDKSNEKEETNEGSVSTETQSTAEEKQIAAETLKPEAEAVSGADESAKSSNVLGLLTSALASSKVIFQNITLVLPESASSVLQDFIERLLNRQFPMQQQQQLLPALPAPARLIQTSLQDATRPAIVYPTKPAVIQPAGKGTDNTYPNFLILCTLLYCSYLYTYNPVN